LCGQSVGAFEKGFVYRLLTLILKDAAAITCREKITSEFLMAQGVRRNLFETSDLAFLLKPCTDARLEEIRKLEGIDPNERWIGISISALIGSFSYGPGGASEKEKAYIRAMADLADYIIENHSMKVLFIPHVTIPGKNDDRELANRVIGYMKNSRETLIPMDIYDASELKGLIGICEAFVGSRMHATIAALSQCIPTLTYVYNHKTIGINGKMLGQDKYLLDIRGVKPKDFVKRNRVLIRDLLEEAGDIRKELEFRLSDVRTMALKNIDIAVALLDSAGPLLSMADSRFCTGCGTCVGVCSKGALHMEMTVEGTYRPRLHGDCNGCNVCTMVCPAHGMDLAKHEKMMFDERAPDAEIGVVRGCYAGYSNQADVRYGGSSGGLVTAINMHLLGEETVDAILVTGMHPKNPTTPLCYWARTESDLIAAKGSKYTPVPLNTALKEIPQDAARLAIVGLPCHLWGLRLWEQAGFLRGRSIEYRFALFCGRTPSLFALDFILQQLGISRSEIVDMSYRGQGWPGGLRLATGGKEFFYPLDTVWDEVLGTAYFTPLHCYRCPDFFGYLSDISFGDAWLPEYDKNTNGWSLCISRSHKGDDLLREMKNKNLLHLENQSVESVKRAMIGNIRNKISRKEVKNAICGNVYPVHYDSNGTKSKNIRDFVGEKYKYILTTVGNSQLLVDALLSFPENKTMKLNSKNVKL
jgi:coenzyme F420 hydrogenase subunit beta